MKLTGNRVCGETEAGKRHICAGRAPGESAESWAWLSDVITVGGQASGAWCVVWPCGVDLSPGPACISPPGDPVSRSIPSRPPFCCLCSRALGPAWHLGAPDLVAAVRSRPHVRGWLCDTILAMVPQRQTWLACPTVCFHLPSPFVLSGTWLLTYNQQRGAPARWAAGPGPVTCG